MIAAGATAEIVLEVRYEDTAHALSVLADDTFPEVLATSRMIALMELAAAKLLRPLLGRGELSVGVTVDIRHTAATPVGGHVRAVATYAGPEGKLHRFRVEAFDDAGPIGAGEHTRAIIAAQRLEAGAARRRAPAR
ncbi:MAG TPA: thioesterase [Usitatibacter sp.]|nr:thioesterase [Usitatibacter sp.]